MGDFQQIQGGQQICVFGHPSAGFLHWLEKADFTQCDERCLGPKPNQNGRGMGAEE
jgi:hypothetical protein